VVAQPAIGFGERVQEAVDRTGECRVAACDPGRRRVLTRFVQPADVVERVQHVEMSPVFRGRFGIGPDQSHEVTGSNECIGDSGEGVGGHTVRPGGEQCPERAREIEQDVAQRAPHGFDGDGRDRCDTRVEPASQDRSSFRH
jgi:hypothetical protein